MEKKNKIIEILSFIVIFFITVTVWDIILEDAILWQTNIILTVISSLIYAVWVLFIKKKKD